jgi:hypothetical protein
MAAVAGLSAVDAPAAAASDGYGSCGSGYHQIDSWTLPLTSGSNVGGGKLLLYYNSSNGYNCAITQATGSSFGRSNQYISVSLDRSDLASSQFDSGRYRYYAGPVYVHAPGACIDVAGGIDVRDSSMALVSRHDIWRGRVHCG